MFFFATIALILSELCVGTNSFDMILFGGLFTAGIILSIYYEAFKMYDGVYILMLKRHYASVGITVSCLIISEFVFVLSCKLLHRFEVDTQYLQVCGNSLGINTGILLAVIVLGIVCSVFTLDK